MFVFTVELKLLCYITICFFFLFLLGLGAGLCFNFLGFINLYSYAVEG